MAETEFLSAVETYLAAAELTPPPAAVGVAEPDSVAGLPAVVLSLEASERAGNGLGERSALITGSVLPWEVSIDLANPVLPEDPSFSLLNPGRTVLALPHGGLVRRDGGAGPLAAGDLSVSVDGVPRPVVAGLPAGAEVGADPTVGQLTFGSALPATGTVDVAYFLAQWEQRVARISGVLRVDVCAANATDARSLGDAVVNALLLPRARTEIRRLLAIGVTGLTSIGAPEPAVPLRRRTARLSFLFEHVVDRPESSGGVIGRIPITTKLDVATVGRGTGAIRTTVVTVAG